MNRLLLAALLALPLTLSAQHSHDVNTCRQRHRHNQRIASDPQLQANNSRSDTVDVLHYTIALDITDFTTDTIRGYTDVKFTVLMNNVLTLDLDLLEMTIDSVLHNGNPLVYSYNDTLLRVSLPVAHNIGDTSTVRVRYRGVPQGDASGWGGFYFQSGYAFNLGVGFAADPHNYGRVWFPCFDNFVERSTYTFAITTSNGKVAYCNGLLASDTTIGALRTRTWEMGKSIPSYLASVAVAGYTQVNQVFNSVNGPIPIILAALPADTTPMKNSFINLGNALTGFENRFGPYRFERVGYVLVPFSSGAMEHASNIAYPRAAANGSLTYEAGLMSHELAHMWWGDLATCRTAEDMWLNEGWASYSEFVFTEWMYGANAYKNAVRVNHEDMLHYVHITENGYRAVSGVPHAYTYSDHVYRKGADMAHTLRGYMGDSLFWLGLQYHLNQSQFTDVSSADFRDNLIAATGLTYLNDYFNDWVFNGGWPHFSIDSFKVVPNGPNYDVQLFFKQKLDGAPAYANNVPLEVKFYDANWNTQTRSFMISGQTTMQTVTIPINPVYAALDFDEKISDATADEWRVISTTGQHNMTLARCNLTVNSISDSALIRVEHNFAPPDPLQNNPNNYNISDYRYWNIDGILPSNFYATGRFYYDGRSTTSGGNGHLDNALTVPNGDSIILLYRRGTHEEWQEYPHYTKTIIGPSASSKYGYVVADSLKLGQYAFANGVSTVLIGLNEPQQEEYTLDVFPNPADEQVTLQWETMSSNETQVRVYDVNGRLVHDEQTANTQLQLNTSEWMSGLYFVQVQNGETLISRKLLVK